MKHYLLDTSALLTVHDNETGSDQVAELLQQVQQKQVICYSCFITQMEIYYRVWQDQGRTEGRLAYQQCQSLPIQWPAEIKATHRLSLAGAWIAASAQLCQAILVHKDPEFEALEQPQLILPYKT